MSCSRTDGPSAPRSSRSRRAAVPRSEQSHALAAASLRSGDREHYYATLILPRAPRPHVQAIWAFAAELAAIRARVSEPAAGEIRLQWWIDALAGTGHGSVRANPVADALLDTVETCSLELAPLSRLAEAQRADLHADPMPSLTAFETWAGQTVSVPFQYAAIVVAAGTDPGSADAAGHLGVAEALTRCLLTLPADLAEGRIRLPLEIFVAAGASQAELVAGTVTPAVMAATAELRALARHHLARAREAASGLAPDIRSVFAPAAVVALHLDRLETSANAPLQPVQPVANWRKIVALTRWALGS